jgi:hypothetical protein
VSRPKTDPVEAERSALIRIAELAGNIMNALRQPGRGKYDSERHLSRWLVADGHEWTTADLSPALALLEATGRLMRPATASQTTPRPGWLARDADLWANAELSDEARVASLIDAVIRALHGVNGFSGQCQSKDELQARLAAAGVVYDPADLSAALTRLEDSGRMLRPSQRPTREQPHPPQPLLLRSSSYLPAWEPFSRIDALAADIIASIRSRGDRFKSDEQLAEWLAEDGTIYTERGLADALSQLLVCGLLIRPDPEGWGAPRRGYLNTPSVARAPLMLPSCLVMPGRVRPGGASGSGARIG